MIPVHRALACLVEFASRVACTAVGGATVRSRVAGVAALAVLLAVVAPPPLLAQTPPATPDSVTVTRADGTLTASWTAVAGATSYWITYSSDGGASWSLAARNHTQASITVSPIINSATYLVGVRARNGHGDSGWRNSPAAGPFVPPPPPATPGPVTVTRADGTLTASWDAVDGATGYWITYSSDGGASWSLAALNHTGTGITVSPVTNSATYLVGVRARNEHGDSGWRNSPAAGPFVPPAALSIGDAEVEEGDALSFTVTLDSAVPGGFTVTPSFTDGTATAGSDYTANTSALAFTGTAGETRTFTVSTGEDTDIEDDETFTVGLTVSGSAHDVAAGDTATGTIADNDQAEVSSTLTIGDASASEGDTISFTVTLGTAVPGGLTVTPTFTDGVPAQGRDLSYFTATRGQDYRASELSLDFAGTAGETVTFTVPTIEDRKAEYPELFTVGLSVSGTSHRVTGTDTATGIIYDDDAVAAAASGGAVASSSQIVDNGSSITIYSPKDPVLGRMEYQCTIPKRVTETADTSLRFKHFQIACGARPGAIRAGAVVEFWSSGSATATKGSSGDWDYEFFHQKTKFWPGDKSIQRLGYRINDDEQTEGPEYFQFALKWTTKVGLGWLGIWLTLNESVHTVTVWIDDDDEYNLSVAPASVTEAGGAKTVTVTAAVADGAVLAEARKLGIQVGKSGDLAVEGTDYQNVGDFDITIPKGSDKGTGTFNITPTVDAHLEPNERITVSGSLKSAINGKTLSARVNGAALWLKDSSVVALSASPSVNEGGGTQTVTVTATSTGTAQRATPVTVSVGKSGDAAVEGTDYRAVSDFILTIPSGSKTGTGTFQITPINDTAVEDDETITLSGSIPGGTVTDGSLTLLDNDVTLSLSPASTGEEAGARTVTVTARAKSARPAARALTVSVGKVGDSAEDGTDYGTVADFSLTIPANQAIGTATFTFTPRDDKIIEGTETVTVGGTGTGLDVGRAALSLTETDTTDFVITLNPNPVAEGVNWRNLTVTVSTTDGYTVSKKVTCQFQNGGGSATWGSDYYIYYSNKGIKPPGTPGTSIIPTLTINAGQTSGSKTVRLRTVGDNTVEGDETVQIKGYSLHPQLYKSCRSSDNPRTVDSDPYPADLTIVDDETSISLSASPSSVAEDAGDTSVTVTAKMGGNRNAPADMPVTVTFGKSTDSATSGTDYEAIDAFKITIPQGKKSATKTITFTPKDDTLAEDDETVTLTGKTPRTSVGSTQLTIDDDDDTGITLTASPASVAEGGGAKTVTVTAKTDGTTFPAPRYVNVQVGKTGDGATEGTDYKTVADFTVTIPFAKTEGTGTFTLTPVDDSTLESDESIGIGGTTSASDTVTGTSVTLKDNDAEIALAASPDSVTENGGAKTVTVTATAAKAVEADTALTIAVGQSGDSAVEGTDYSTVADFTLTIKSGKTKGTGTFTLTPVDDALYEGASESLTVSGSATGLRVGTASVAITDDDPETEVSLSLNPTRVKECGADTEVWVTAKLPDSADAVSEDRKVTVSVGKSGDGATSGTDYTAVNDFDLTIPAGHRSGLASFELQPVDDHDVEGDETITVHGAAARLKVKNEPRMTLVDDDQPIVVLTMNPAVIPENDTETSVTVTASLFTGDFCGKTHDVAGSGGAMGSAGAPARSAASMKSIAARMVGASAAEIARAVLGPGARAVKANSARSVTVSVGDTGDTATSGTDYTAVSNFTVSIPAGKSSGTATFKTTASLDNLLEPQETVTVKGASTGTTVTPAGGHVADKDQASPTLTVNPSSVSESAGATTVTVTVTTGGVKSSQRFEVPIRVSGGTATAGTDFAKVKDFDLVLAANATSGTGTFTLTPTDDTLVEGDETLNVIIPGTTLSAAMTLTDDDDGTITLTVSPASVPENAGDESVTVTAATGGGTFAADRTVTVTVGDSADSATSGTDYAAVSSFDITITAGQTSGSATFTLTPTQDTVVEGDETISVDGTSTGVTVNGASITLTDDDSTDITLRLSPSSVSEKDEATEVTVTAATGGNTFAADRTVTVSVGANADSATSGTDYAAVADLDVTIEAGKTSGSETFTLTPKQDTLVEGDEAVSVTGTSTGLTVNGTSATIGDDDSTPEVNLTASPKSVSEGASGTTVTVTAAFSNSSTYGEAKTVSVTVGDSTDSATSGTDYAAVTGFDVTIAAGKSSGTATFTLTPTNDTLIEGNETISVDGASTGLTVNGTSVTLADDDGAPAINLSANPSSVSEGASGTTVTVTAAFSNSSTFGEAKTVSVTVGDSADSATSGTDYAAVTGFDIGIGAGKTTGSATFTLTPTQDTLVEGDETISVDGTSTGLTVNGTSVTLSDDDSTELTLTASPASVGEDDDDTTVTVTAETDGDTLPADRTVRVKIGKAGDSATSGTDYAAVTAFDVTIAKGETSGTGTFTLNPTDDNIIEGDETITVSGTSTGLTVNGASVTIEDAEEPDIILEIEPILVADPDSLPESAGATRVTVKAGTEGGVFDLDRQIYVTVGKDGDSAEFGSDKDYDTPSRSFHVLIEKGKTSGKKTFTLTPTDDTLVEGDETLTLTGSAAGLEVTEETITIKDNDVPGMALSVSPASVSEGDNPTEVTVTASTGGVIFKADRTVSVTVGKSGDGATSGTDYKAVAGFDITIEAGENSGTGKFTLSPLPDTLVEGGESIGVDGTTAGLTVTGTSVTLTDDDAAPAVNLTASPSSVAEGADATRVTVTATFSNKSTYAADTTVTVSVGDSGSATSGTDYATVADFDIVIGAGKSSGSATFELRPTQDAVVEGNETIGVDGTSTALTVNGTDVTLTDDDGAPAINLSVDPSSVSEGAGATTVTVTATFSNANTYTADTTVTVSVGDRGDSATSGTDYAAVTDFEVTVGAGKSSGSATFTLTPVNDTRIEGNETIGVDGTSKALTVNGTDVTLADDDGTPAVNLSVDPSSVSEEAGATEMTVTATFSNASTYASGTKVTVTVGDTKDSATSGADYAAVTDFDITIAAGASSGKGTFTLTPRQDYAIEGREKITLGGSSSGLTVNAASIFLTDEAPPVVNLSVDPSSVSEGAGATAVTVTATFSNSVTYSTAKTVTVSVGDGTDGATSGTDYAAVPDFDIAIAAGKSSGTGTFTLTPAQDTLVEGNETVTLSGTNTALTVNGTSVTLTDDDGAPAIDLSAKPSSIAEDAGATTVTVTAAFSNGSTYAADTTVTVSVGDAADSAASGTDYAAVGNFAITIPAGQTSGSAPFTLAPVDDTLVEGNETITVSGTSTALTVNGTSVTLTDDDGAPAIDLSAKPSSIAEDAGATTVTVTAAFSNASIYGADTTVTVSVGDAADSAASGTDYAAVGNFAITIPAGQTSGSAPFTLAPVDDTLVEGNETITVSGTSTALTVNGTSVTLTDDDGAPAIDLSAKPSSVREGDGATTVTVTAAFSNASIYGADTTVTVSVGKSGDDATSGIDYAAVSDFRIAIPAGSSSATGTFVLTPANDNLVEGDERIAVSGASPGLTVTGTGVTLADAAAVAREPRAVSVADASAREGEVLRFKVTLDKAPGADGPVTIGYATRDGTARAGADYAAVSGTLTFAAGETAKTVAVATLDDALDEGDETLFLRLTASANATLARSSAKGTIGNEDPLPAAWLARCGRVAFGHVADAVEARLAERETGPRLVVGGQDVPLESSGVRFDGDPAVGTGTPETRTMTGGEALAGSAFRVASGDGRAASGRTRWTAWGSGSATRFEGSEASLSLDGEALGVTLGLDAERGRWTAGVAVARNACSGTWRDGKSGESGSVETPLTSVHPYARWTMGKLSLWLMAGLGRGEFTVANEDGGVRQENDVGLTMTGLGGRRDLASAEGGAGIDLAARWNALVVRVTSDAAENLRPVDAWTSRARLALEAGRTFALPGAGGSVSPSLEFGVRHDGGDAETGAGLEIGGGIRYADPSRGLTVELRGSGLVAHGDGDYREWSAGGAVQLDPGADGLGLSLSVRPSWGNPESGASVLWDGGAHEAAERRSGGAGRLDAELGYGVRTWKGRAVVTPMAGFSGSGTGERTWRVGSRLVFRGGLEASLTGESGRSGGETGHGVSLRARWRW